MQQANSDTKADKSSHAAMRYCWCKLDKNMIAFIIYVDLVWIIKMMLSNSAKKTDKKKKQTNL